MEMFWILIIFIPPDGYVFRIIKDVKIMKDKFEDYYG